MVEYVQICIRQWGFMCFQVLPSHGSETEVGRIWFMSNRRKFTTEFRVEAVELPGREEPLCDG